MDIYQTYFLYALGAYLALVILNYIRCEIICKQNRVCRHNTNIENHLDSESSTYYSSDEFSDEFSDESSDEYSNEYIEFNSGIVNINHIVYENYNSIKIFFIIVMTSCLVVLLNSHWC